MSIQNTIPRHVAIIMDGNGRWATKNKKLRALGHKAGAENVENAVKIAIENNLKVLTIFAFSDENWKRKESEIRTLMRLKKLFIKNKGPELVKKRVKVTFIGNRDDGRLPPDLLAQMSELEHKSAGGNKLHLIIAVNYGSEDEQNRAVSKAFARSSTNWKDFLDTAGVSDPEIVIRTGCDDGTWRDSDFLTFQSRKAMKVPMEVLWPDFGSKHLCVAIQTWQHAAKLDGGQRPDSLAAE